MNSWCESCARKNCCYTMEIRPKCYVATTNTASGTPESYLAKSLRYSRDSHEIAKDEPQTCDTCKYGEDKHRYTHICNECGVGINNYEPKTEPTISKMEQVDKDINVRSKDCTTCKHAGEVYEDPCELCYRHSHYEQKDEPQTEEPDEMCQECKHWEKCSKEDWRECRYTPKDEQTDCAWNKGE